jgi:hypothetical protein
MVSLIGSEARYERGGDIRPWCWMNNHGHVRGISEMAQETLFKVQSFRVGRGTRLIADPAVACKTAQTACRTAERLALTRVGVIACSLGRAYCSPAPNRSVSRLVHVLSGSLGGRDVR